MVRRLVMVVATVCLAAVALTRVAKADSVSGTLEKQPPPLALGTESSEGEGEDSNVGWRELGPEESVPRGSHVRMNLSTGRKWIKEEELTLEKNDPDALRERVLYGLPDPDPRLPSAAERSSMSPEEYKELLGKVWRMRQAEVAKAIEAMDDTGATIANLTKVISTEDAAPEVVVDALEELEWIVQDIDQAMHFASLGGIDMCTHLMQSEDAVVRRTAAYVLGSAVKDHEEMQSLAIKSGVLMHALDSLAALSPSCAAGPDDGLECAKMLYALSSTVRGHAEGQQEAVRLGLDSLLSALVGSSIGLGDVPAPVLTKVLSLIQDSASWDPACRADLESADPSGLCKALEHRAQSMEIAHRNVPNISPSVKRLALRLRQAMTAAQCNLRVLENRALFQQQEEEEEE